MAGCCAGDDCALQSLRNRQRSVLVAVLAINAVLFVVEITAGVLASSTALLADSLDMLGDALVYGFSLYAVARSDLWKARAAALKGWIMLLFGIAVLVQAVAKWLFPELPSASTMGVMALVALGGNSVCLALLWRHRGDDVNMSSVWICSRNDIVANVAVLGAGVMVWRFASQTPDVLVGLGIAALFIRSAIGVLRDAREADRSARAGVRLGVAAIAVDANAATPGRVPAEA